MRRMLLVLTLSVMLLVSAVAGSGLPAALAQDEPEAPGAPQCDWYFNSADRDEWWEYWCWWPGFGWEFVFWVWA